MPVQTIPPGTRFTDPLHITYSTTVNMTTRILLAIYLHSRGYEYVFEKLYSHPRVKTIELISLQINIMEK